MAAPGIRPKRSGEVYEALEAEVSVFSKYFMPRDELHNPRGLHGYHKSQH